MHVTNFRPKGRPFGALLSLLTLVGFLSSDLAHATGGTIYYWTGLSDNYLYSTGNWENDTPPPDSSWNREDDITGIILHFGNSRRTYIEYYNIYASQLVFDGFDQPYNLKADYGTTLHLGSGGILYNPTQDFWSRIEDNIALHGSQVWAINNGTLEIKGSINDYLGNESYGDYQIEKTGAGTLWLDGTSYSDWNGGLKLSGGKVVVGSGYSNEVTALGDGPLTFNGGSLILQGSNSESSTTLYNGIVSNGTIAIHSDGDLSFSYESDYFRLDADTTLQFSGGPFYIEQDITENEGTGPHKLTINSTTAIVHYGNSLWGGGTDVQSGIFIFGGEGNLPQSGAIHVGDDGYVGTGASNSTSTFLGLIDLANSTGSIGFDSDPDSGSGPDTFLANIDLTGANANLRIGSATEAILGDYANFSTALEQITPQGANYQFGGGGGSLYVASLLTDNASPRGISVDSPDETPLTVWLLNPNNDLTGNVSVNNSALIYGANVTPPSGTTFTLTNTGYVGTAETEFTAAAWLSYFASNTTGIVGFDVFHDAGTGWDIANLDTSAFSSIVIGSATFVRDSYGDFVSPGLTLTGTLTPNSDGSHRFAAYKGGAVAVSGTLTGSSLIIGGADSIATFGDRLREEYSTVLISGDNSGHLANGTTFYSGRLMIGQSNGIIGDNPTTALGTGALTVAPVNFTEPGDDESPTPLLATTSTGIVIPNNIVINADALGVGGDHSFELSGNISGPGELYVGEDSDYFQLTLSGNNTFSGGLYVSNSSTVHVNTDTGTGTGALGFGNSGGSVYFNSQNPVIHGFEKGDSSYSSINLNYDGPRTLTIIQNDYSQFYGSLSATGDSTIIKQGAGALRFNNTSIYTDGIADGQGNNIGLDIQQGTVVFSNNSGIYDSNYGHSTAVKLSGGTLAVDGGTTFSNPVVVGSGSRLAGFGTYTQSVSIGDGAILSPGLAGNGMTGSMQFHHLELDAGGIYEYNIQSPDYDNYIARDYIQVYSENPGTLVINADSDHPFIIKVVSLDAAGDPGTLTGIDTGFGTYSWTLINFDALSIPGTGDVFDASLFALDLTGFSSDALQGGDFSISLSGNNVMLNFTPVPEPSTYAMMALGLGLVVWSIRRRRAKA